jgi:hypothetical protein
MIYFAEMVGHDDSPIKIGETEKLSRARMKMLQTGNPYILDVIVTMPGDRKTERELHQRFKDWRCPGGKEWYFPNPELSALIQGLKEKRRVVSPPR